MSASRNHVIDMPRNFVVLRSFQLVFAVILLGLSIASFFFYASVGALIVLISAVLTIVVAGYTIGSERAKDPKSYNYWAILVLEIFLLLAWLVSAIFMGFTVAYLAYLVSDDYDYGYYYYKRATRYKSSASSNHSSSSYSDDVHARLLVSLGIAGATTGLAALQFIFYFISLTIFGVHITRHRNSGGQSTQLPYNAAALPYSPQAGAGQEKYVVQPQAQAYPVSPGAVPAYPVQSPQQLYGGYYQPQPQQQPQPQPQPAQ